MSEFLSSLGLPEVVAGIIVLALNAYALMGGADFGGGLWDLVASGPRRQAQRDLIGASIAPIWEANHVWLIVDVVVLFTAFPAAFSTLGIVLHIPLTLMLIGIVLRGSAFVFRSYGSRAQAHQRRWGLAFAIASTVTPVLLGIVVGAISSGAVGEAASRIGTGSGSFAEVFVRPWLNAYAIAVGLFALVLFAFLAAVYLALAAPDDALREDFRKRALAAAAGVFVLAGVALLLAAEAAPRLAHGVATSAWAVVLHLLTGAAAITAIVALWRRRYRLARVAAVAQVSCILWGWAFAQYPFVVPPTLSIDGAAAPRETLVLLLAGLAVGALALIPSLRYLFRTFTTAGESARGRR
jgi:cytochrome d ubiquinol oxidase subunit II